MQSIMYCIICISAYLKHAIRDWWLWMTNLKQLNGGFTAYTEYYQWKHDKKGKSRLHINCAELCHVIFERFFSIICSNFSLLLLRRRCDEMRCDDKVSFFSNYIFLPVLLMMFFFHHIFKNNSCDFYPMRSAC